MSLDNITTLTIANTPSLREVLSEINNTALIGTIVSATATNILSTANMLLLQQGNKGVDMPDPQVVTRPVADGVGDILTVNRPKSRRFTLHLSHNVAYAGTWGSFIPSISPPAPFTLRVNYDTTSGKQTLHLPLCYYTGGLDRQRHVSGRVNFKLKFMTEHPYFVRASKIASGTSFTPTTVRGRGAVWGITANTSTAQAPARIRVKMGTPITGANDPDAWVWELNPANNPSPPPLEISGIPTGIVACFSPPYKGIYGADTNNILGYSDISSGRTSGPALPQYLQGTQAIYVEPATYQIWYWKDYLGW